MSEKIGVIDGVIGASTQIYQIAVHPDEMVQLDDIVTCTSRWGNDKEVTHFGIVTEILSSTDGAALASDNFRAAEGKLPTERSTVAKVSLLRSWPEYWVPPQPGAAVYRLTTTNPNYAKALFLDQMGSPLPIGMSQAGDTVYLDMDFVTGKKAAHISISGISGAATKTTYAMFLLYMLFETPEGRRILGPQAAQARALVFNSKGEDLLHLDQPNRNLTHHPEALAQWQQLGVSQPGPFASVQLYAPAMPGTSITADVKSRPARDVVPFGWTPEDFIRQGLLQFCFTDPNDRDTQVSFIEQRVRTQLLRHAYPCIGKPGAVVLADPPPHCTSDWNRLVGEKRTPLHAGDGDLVENFSNLVEFLSNLIDTPNGAPPAWSGSVSSGTQMAFLRRLYALVPRLGHLMRTGLTSVELNRGVNVVDIHNLHDAAQRFVVGAILARIYREKEGFGREPLRFIVLDELNKFAPLEGQSPIKEAIKDIAERGRSQGVILLGAQQSAGNVEKAVIDNASVKIVGRISAGSVTEYPFLTPELRTRATRFMPGTMILSQTPIPVSLPVRFPFPGFATNPEEGATVMTSTEHSKLLERL